MTENAKPTPGLLRVDPDYECDIQTADGNLEIAGTFEHFANAPKYIPGNKQGEANARLFVAAWNSYAAHCADPLAAAEGDLLGEALAALKELVNDLTGLISESDGVAGLHKNGDLATWDELTNGGRFEEWIASLETARAICAKAEGKP